uniref:Uncharacterized protein n=1 Tax=viral metagenome TaxID=1070528 RepID=A0A6C0D0Y2_9ZZZZ
MSNSKKLCAGSFTDLGIIATTNYCGTQDSDQICTWLCTLICLPTKIPFLICCLPTAIYSECNNYQNKTYDNNELIFR